MLFTIISDMCKVHRPFMHVHLQHTYIYVSWNVYCVSLHGNLLLSLHVNLCRTQCQE